jgi:hypothetical protein
MGIDHSGLPVRVRLDMFMVVIAAPGGFLILANATGNFACRVRTPQVKFPIKRLERAAALIRQSVERFERSGAIDRFELSKAVERLDDLNGWNGTKPLHVLNRPLY